MSQETITELDTRGLRCPLPLLKTRQVLRHLQAGALLRVVADDAGSATDIPHWLDASQHQLLELVQEEGVTTFLIRQ